jgi:hypothetical protein
MCIKMQLLFAIQESFENLMDMDFGTNVEVVVGKPRALGTLIPSICPKIL